MRTKVGTLGEWYWITDDDNPGRGWHTIDFGDYSVSLQSDARDSFPFNHKGRFHVVIDRDAEKVFESEDTFRDAVTAQRMGMIHLKHIVLKTLNLIRNSIIDLERKHGIDTGAGRSGADGQMLARG